MIRAMIIVSVSALLSGCYQSTSGRATLEDAVPDLSLDDGSSMDVQWDIDDTLDALDVQDRYDGFEDISEEEDYTCDPASLVLQPVSFVGLMWEEEPLDCMEAHVSEVRVLLFHSSGLLDVASPCIGDTVVVGPVSPGNYELAAIAEGNQVFVWGVEKLQILYPDVHCVPEYIACQPLTFTVTSCGITVVPLVLYCDGVFCGPDCCGGA